jgi:hypothetical protein
MHTNTHRRHTPINMSYTQAHMHTCTSARPPACTHTHHYIPRRQTHMHTYVQTYTYGLWRQEKAGLKEGWQPLHVCVPHAIHRYVWPVNTQTNRIKTQNAQAITTKLYNSKGIEKIQRWGRGENKHSNPRILTIPCITPFAYIALPTSRVRRLSGLLRSWPTTCLHHKLSLCCRSTSWPKDSTEDDSIQIMKVHKKWRFNENGIIFFPIIH